MSGNKPFPTGFRMCAHCSDLFERRRRPSGQLEAPKVFARRRFCSVHCSNQARTDYNYRPRGHANAQWKGDAARPETKRARAQQVYSLGPCERCGLPATDRHHIDGDPGNNTAANIACLCRKCHMQIDGRLEQFIAAGGGRQTAPLPPKPCVICGRLAKPLRRGRCGACNEYLRNHGRECPPEIWGRRPACQKIHARLG
jgi:hypothetical protein